MEVLSHEILKFNPNTLQEVRKSYGFESVKDINNAIDILELWISQQSHFVKKKFDRNYLEISLIQSKGSIEKTKKKLDRLCTFRTLMPKFFGDYDVKKDFLELDKVLSIPNRAVFKRQCQHQTADVENFCFTLIHQLERDEKCSTIQVPLPTPLEDNVRVVLLRNWGKKFTDDFLIQYFRATFLLIEHLKTMEYGIGFTMILDYRLTNLTELAMRMDLVDFQQAVKVVMEAYGVSIKGIHIITPSKFVDVIVRIFKGVFSEKVSGRIMIHKDLDSLYHHIPRHILPKDYGGDEKTLDEINDEWKELLSTQEFRDYMTDMNKACTNEELRPRSTFNDEYMGMPGSFRSLDVD